MKITLKAQIFLISGLESSGKKICLLGVLSGGCSGLRYTVTYLDELPSYETIELSPSIYIDELSLSYVSGSTVDLEVGSGYKKIIISNPQAKSSCSCGSSFSV